LAIFGVGCRYYSLLPPCTAAAMRLHEGTSIRPSSRQTVASAPTKVTYFYYCPLSLPMVHGAAVRWKTMCTSGGAGPIVCRCCPRRLLL